MGKKRRTRPQQEEKEETVNGKERGVRETWRYYIPDIFCPAIKDHVIL
jgi:hypothetical protein